MLENSKHQIVNHKSEGSHHGYRTPNLCHRHLRHRYLCLKYLCLIYLCLLSPTSVENPLQIGPIMQNKPNFQNAQMNVTSFEKTDYHDLAALRLRKNKPNSKPNKANFRNAQMNLNFFFTKDYKNHSLRSLPAKQTQSNPIFGTNECKLLSYTV